MVRSRGLKRVMLVSVLLLVLFAFILRLSSGAPPALQQIIKDVPNLITRRDVDNGNNNNNNNNNQDDRNGAGSFKLGGGLDGGFAAMGLSFKKSNEQLDLARKLNEMTQKLVDDQEKRIIRLEKERTNLEKQLSRLRTPTEGMSLREKLAYLYPYDAKRKFPGYVWQSWRWGLNDDRFGDEFKKGEERWAQGNPGFVHEIFNDDTSNAFIHYLYLNVPEVINAYDTLPNMALKMDFFRYLILFAKGGVWADIDTYPVKPVPNWIPENVAPTELGMVVGTDHDAGDDDIHARRFQFSNAVIQAKPGHPVLRDMIAEIVERTRDKNDRNDLRLTDDDRQRDIDMMNWSGEGIWTDVILRFFNDYVLSGVFTRVTWKDFHELEVPKLVSDVLVMPRKVFESPFKYAEDEGEDNNNDDDSDPLVFVRHRHSKVYKDGW